MTYNPVVLTLAQSMADPPTLEHLLLENPWPIVIALVGVAAVFRVIAKRHGRPRLNSAVIVALVFALGVYITARVVQTPREQVSAAVRALLDATVNNDASVLDALIDPRAVLADESGSVRVAVGELRGELGLVLDRYPIASQGVKELGVETRGQRTAAAYLDLRTGFTNNAYPPAHTTWLMTWEREDADSPWRLVEVRWLGWMGRTPPWGGWR